MGCACILRIDAVVVRSTQAGALVIGVHEIVHSLIARVNYCAPMIYYQRWIWD